MQIGVARTPPLEHVFGQSLRHLAHNNRRSRVERRSTGVRRFGLTTEAWRLRFYSLRREKPDPPHAPNSRKVASPIREYVIIRLCEREQAYVHYWVGSRLAAFSVRRCHREWQERVDCGTSAFKRSRPTADVHTGSVTTTVRPIPDL